MSAQREPAEVTYRKDYRPYPFDTPEVQLTFDLHDHETMVTSEFTVVRKPGSREPLVLDGVGLDLHSLAVDGVELQGNEYVLGEQTLTIHDVPDRCRVEITVAVDPQGNKALEGLYKSNALFCTQNEPHGFPHITFFPDRPDVLSRFTTVISADAKLYPTLLSNGNRTAATGPDASGRHTVTWHDPFPKPTYLFALVAGNLAVLEDSFVTCSGRRVSLRVYAEPKYIEQCRYPMDVLKRAMRWDEERFGREYDLDLFMIVAVEDFNAGAMENKGLNIFNISASLADPDTATDERYAFVERVIAHEYFHNWSGNRVTCRDFFQLPLKEGFTVYRDQEFSGDMNSALVKRIDDADLLRTTQFVEDASPMAHPVRLDRVVDVSNFYTTTVYEKAAELVRMLETLLGAERFRAGCDTYFERHDGHAVTIEDFVRAMADASGLDLTQFRRWYDQAGTPRLTIAERRVGDVLEIEISQSCDPTPGQEKKLPFTIPLALGLVRDGEDLLGAAGLASGSPVVCEASAPITQGDAAGTLVLELEGERTVVKMMRAPADAAVSLHRCFSAPVRVDYPRPPHTLRRLALTDTDGFARWDVAQLLLGRSILAAVSGTDDATADEAIGMVRELAEAAFIAPDDGEAKAQIAASLTLPNATWLLELAPGTDILAITGATDRLAGRIADDVDWLALVDANETGPYSTRLPDVARRRLKHRALWYALKHLDRVDPTLAIERLVAILERADNLTDRAAALRGFVNLESLGDAGRVKYLEEFYGRWASEPLVVDLWLAIQATSPLSGGLARVAAVEAHDAYNVENPNKVRALLGEFSTRNPWNFHDTNNDAYHWFAERVVAIDGNNAQLAARIARVLVHWRKHNASRGERMRATLEWMSDHALSVKLREVVDRALVWR